MVDGYFGQPKARIIIDTDDVTRAGRVVDQVARNMDRSFDGVTNRLRAMGQEAQGLTVGAGVISGLGIAAANSVDKLNNRYLALTGSMSAGAALQDRIAQSARELEAPILAAQQGMQRLIPLIGTNADEVDRLVSLVVRLASIDPGTGGGIEGAAFAISEALSSGGTDLVSLVERFGISRVAIREALAENGGNFAAALDEVLNKIGANEAAVQRFGGTLEGTLRSAQDSFQRLLAEGFTPTLRVLTGIIRGAADFAERINETAPGVTALAGALLSALTVAGALVVATGTIATNLAALKSLGVLSGIGGLLGGAGALGGFAGIASLAGPIAILVAGLAGLAIVIEGVNQQAAAARAEALEPLREELNILLDDIRIRIPGIIPPELRTMPALREQDREIEAAKEEIPKSTETLEQSATSNLQDVSSPLVDFLNGQANLMQATDALANAGVDNERIITFLEQAQQGLLTVQELTGLLSPDEINALSLAMLGTRDITANAITEIASTYAAGAAQIEEASQALNRADVSNFVQRLVQPLGLNQLGNLDWEAAQANSVVAAQAYNQQNTIIGRMFQNWTEAQEAQEAAAERTSERIKAFWSGALDAGNTLFDVLDRTRDMMQSLREEQDAVDAARDIQDDRDAFDFLQRRLEQIQDFYARLAEMERAQLEREQQLVEQIAAVDTAAQQQETERLQDFYKNEARELEDHLKRMDKLQRDFNRDYQAAVGRRDVEAAINAMQRYEDAAADETDAYNTAKARRQEDLDDMLTNMKAQSDARRADMVQQLQDQRAQFNRQRDQQIAAFNQQLQREDYWRTIQAIRADQDRAREDAARVAAANKRIADLTNSLFQEDYLLNVGLSRWIGFLNGVVGAIPGVGGARVGGGGGPYTPTPLTMGDQMYRQIAREEAGFLIGRVLEPN